MENSNFSLQQFFDDYFSREKEKKILKRKSSKYRKDRMKIMLHYGNGKLICNCCKIEKGMEFLTIDHVLNDGHAHRKIVKSIHEFHKWIIENEYPPFFQILCYDCNFAKSHDIDNICPHKRLEQKDEIVFEKIKSSSIKFCMVEENLRHDKK